MKHKRFLTKKAKDNISGYLFILPTIIGFLTFMIYPMFYSIYLSLMDWDMFRGASGSTFIGFKNYEKVFENEYFQAGIINNFKLTLLAVPLLIVSALLISTLLNQKIYGRGMLRVAYFMPYVTTITAAAVVFSALFHPEMGPVNGFLKAIGIANPPGWTGSIDWALPTVVLFWVWRNLGYCIILFLAGLQNISKSYYEAASIDGAGAVRKFFSITLPLISPITFFLTITSVIGSFQIFPEVKVMTDGGPGTATMTMVFHIFREAFERYNLGYGSAVAIVFFIIILIITGIQWIGQKKWVNY